MHPRRNRIVPLLAVCLVAIATLPACGRGKGLKVTSALRAERYKAVGQAELTASNPQDHLLLVVDLDGLTMQEFDALPREKVYLAAGDQRFKLQNVQSSMIVDSAGKVAGGSVLLVASVPRSALHFTLYLGDRPPLAFDADPAILPEIRNPK